MSCRPSPSCPSGSEPGQSRHVLGILKKKLPFRLGLASVDGWPGDERGHRREPAREAAPELLARTCPVGARRGPSFLALELNRVEVDFPSLAISLGPNTSSVLSPAPAAR